MIYKILSANGNTVQNTVQSRDILGRAIFALALAEKETVYFHGFKDDLLGGAATILLECSDVFAQKVKQTFGADVEPYTWSHATERKPSIQAYYSKPAPSRPVPPRP